MKKIILPLISIMSFVSVHSALADSEYRNSRYIAEMKKYEHELFFAAKNDKWDEVIKLSDRLLMNMPNHPDVLFWKAKALSHFGKYEEALKNYELVREINSCIWLSEVYIETLYCAIAECLFKLQEYERALWYYNCILGNRTVNDAYVEEEMKKIREEFKKSDRYKKIKQLEKELDKSESLDKLDKAIAIADKLIKLTYESGQIHSRKAKALALCGRYEEAIKSYKAALEYGSYVDQEYHWNTASINKNDIHQLIVDSFIALEDFEGALEYYNSLTPFYRDNDSLKQSIERVKVELEKKLKGPIE